MNCRLLVDAPAAGAWNMAVDEVLWEWSGASGGCCLRLYRWSEPTLSLGYFQRYDQRQEHAASLRCPAVRRISGGGAIVHDAELTYSLAVPLGHSATTGRRQLYEAVHRVIVDLLADFGVVASIEPAGDSARRATEPFLCFQRRSPGDVLVGQVKVAGSAQRRSHAAVLQHGSFLLARSPAAPELPGLSEVARRDFAPEQVMGCWLETLSAQLRLRWIADELSQEERHRAARLVDGKHLAERWVIGRGRRAGQNSLDIGSRPG